MRRLLLAKSDTALTNADERVFPTTSGSNFNEIE